MASAGSVLFSARTSTRSATSSIFGKTNFAHAFWKVLAVRRNFFSCDSSRCSSASSATFVKATKHCSAVFKKARTSAESSVEGAAGFFGGASSGSADRLRITAFMSSAELSSLLIESNNLRMWSNARKSASISVGENGWRESRCVATKLSMSWTNVLNGASACSSRKVGSLGNIDNSVLEFPLSECSSRNIASKLPSMRSGLVSSSSSTVSKRATRSSDSAMKSDFSPGGHVILSASETTA